MEEKGLLTLCSGSGSTKLLQALQRQTRNSPNGAREGPRRSVGFFSPPHCSHRNLFNTLALRNEVKAVPFLSYVVPRQGKFPRAQKSTA